MRELACPCCTADTDASPASQVFSHLTDLGYAYENAEDPWFLRKIPFRTHDKDDLPHPGLRAYPFLGQVGIAARHELWIRNVLAACMQ
jgi:hypothetical protein